MSAPGAGANMWRTLDQLWNISQESGTLRRIALSQVGWWSLNSPAQDLQEELESEVYNLHDALDCPIAYDVIKALGNWKKSFQRNKRKEDAQRDCFGSLSSFLFQPRQQILIPPSLQHRDPSNGCMKC